MKTKCVKNVLLMLFTMVLPLGLRAHAADKPIVIAIYAPNAPFESGTERFAFINRLAQQVTSVAGVQATGKAFARSSDLETAIKNRQVDFAVIDGVYLAERNVPYQVLATATSSGDTAPHWALFSATATKVDELQGKKLSMALSGPRDSEFASNALFDGEVQVGRFFSNPVQHAPDIAAAVAAVNLHKADAVFAPESQGKGLKKVFDVRDRVPNPAFCEIGAQPADVVGRVKQAVLGHGAAGPGLDGWKASGSEAYRALASRMSSRSRRPVMVEPEVVRLEDQDVIVPPALEPGMPELKSLYWQPNTQ
jgi:hypothetical protein